MKFAVIIGVDDYADGELLRPLPYSVAGANGFSDVLVLHGLAKTNQIVLTQSRATKAIIESRLRKLTAELTAEDSLIVYFSGYHLSQRGRNFLTCFDSQLADVAATTVSLAGLVRQIQQSECRQFGLFLNGSDLSAVVDPNCPGEPFNSSEPETLFQTSIGQYCFGACSANEKSLSSKLLKSNIWTFQLNRAFAGLAINAADQENQLTTGSLQPYLLQSVAAELKRTFGRKQNQTPWMVGDVNVVLAGLSDVIADHVARQPLLENAGQVSLVRKRELSIRNLTGFRTRHSVPTEMDERSVAFVGKIARKDLDRDLDAVYAQLKKTFQFKRLEIEAEATDEGFGTIRTPHFDYSVSITQSDSDPAAATFCREVTNIQEFDQILSENFGSVFASVFDTLEFSPRRQVDIESFIDRIEHRNDSRVKLLYERDATWCNLVIDGIDAMLRITGETVEIIKRRPVLPRTLVEMFLEMQEELVDENNEQLLLLK